MSNSSLAFAFDEPSPPLVATAAQTMASELAAGRALSRSDINAHHDGALRRAAMLSGMVSP
jgi:hypothetical protein